MKFLKITVAVFLALPLLLVAVMLLTGMFDDELKPEVIELVKRTQSAHILKQGNAYFPLIGLQAPSGQDFVDAGRKIYDEDVRQIEMAWKGLSYKSNSQVDHSKTLKLKGQSSSICSVLNEHLYKKGICKFQSETDQMLLENRELLGRYYELIKYQTIDEPILGQLWVANEIISLAQLAQADIEKTLQSGEVSKAARLLARDLAFWQGLFHGKYRLLSEAVLQVGYGFRIGATSELYLRWPKLLRNATLRAAVAKPFIREPAILQAQMDLEFMNIYFVRNGADLITYRSTPNDANSAMTWFANRLYRRNATLNAFHTCLSKFYAIRALKGNEQERAFESLSNYEPRMSGLLTNLTGVLALYSACPKRSWLETIDHSRPEARRILVMLQIMLLESQIPEAAIPAFLENVDPSLRDPKTGKAASWNPQRRVVYFSRSERPEFEGLWVRLDQKGGFKFEDRCTDPPERPCGN